MKLAVGGHKIFKNSLAITVEIHFTYFNMAKHQQKFLYHTTIRAFLALSSYGICKEFLLADSSFTAATKIRRIHHHQTLSFSVFFV